MDHAPLPVLFLQYIPEGLVVVALGLLLTGYRPVFPRLMLVAVLSGLTSYLVRSLPIPFGVHTLILAGITAGWVWLVFRVKWRLAVISILVGITSIALAESISIPLITIVTGIPIEMTARSTWLRVLFPLPHMTLLGVLVLCCWRYNWALIRLGWTEDEGMPF